MQVKTILNQVQKFGSSAELVGRYTRRTQVFGFSIADDLEIFGQ